MRIAPHFLIPALILPLAAADSLPLNQRVQQGLRLSEPGLLKLKTELSRSPEHPEKAYWLALVEYGLAGQAKDPKEGEVILGSAMKRLEGRTDADSLGLLGSMCGLRIGFHPEEAMDLVGKAMTCFERAKQQAPGNPRVRLFEAIHQLNTPEAFGGGPAIALPMLEATLAMADGEKPNPDLWVPAWGRAESLAWLALAEARAGRIAEARTHFQRCLQLDPEYGFAKTFVAPLLK